MRRVLKTAALLLTLLLLAGSVAAGLLYKDYIQQLDTPLRTPESGLALTVNPGDSLQKIAESLAAQQVIDSALYLQIYARLEHLATRIKVGEYQLSAALTPRTLLSKLVAGDVVQHRLTIVEGWTFRQMLTAVHAHPRIEPTLRGLDDAAIMRQLGYPGEHPEGRFFPDTYRFPNGTRDVDFLQRAYTVMSQQLEQAWQQRGPDLPLETPYQVLILASIIERETGLDNERTQVAGVFTRRLQKKMRLQTDPTVIYGMGEAFDGNIRRRDLRRDTPYNTYTRAGLPPTPIALPGAASLQAAVNPAAGDALYFVATGDGGHQFSATLAEHNRAVRQYQLKRN